MAFRARRLNFLIISFHSECQIGPIWGLESSCFHIKRFQIYDLIYRRKTNSTGLQWAPSLVRKWTIRCFCSFSVAVSEMNYKARKDGKEEETRRGCGRGEEDPERLVSQTLWISDELIHAAGALITQRCALCSLQNHPPSPELKRWLLSVRQEQVKL